ncbi:hypothetical protein TrRE_jg11605, partial [Triparma retinervis]
EKEGGERKGGTREIVGSGSFGRGAVKMDAVSGVGAGGKQEPSGGGAEIQRVGSKEERRGKMRENRKKVGGGGSGYHSVGSGSEELMICDDAWGSGDVPL